MTRADDYDEHGSHSDDEHSHAHKKAKTKHGNSKPRPPGTVVPGPARTRPTNNQLLYKAHFRLQHLDLTSTTNLIEETDACPSVASCFLQVLQGLFKAEHLRVSGGKRNILQLLSSNTRRTKVVELSSGTHRIPDELKRNFLTDGSGGQYSTNLDRNRYGSDDCYLHTVIRYDLEFLGLCPCLVDVEIIDSKAGNASTLVRCGLEGCICSKKAQFIAAEASNQDAAVAGTSGSAALVTIAPAAGTSAGGGAVAGGRSGSGSGKAFDLGEPRGRGRRVSSPQRSTNSGSSGLLDALVIPPGIQAPGLGGLGGAAALPSLLDVKLDPGVLPAMPGPALMPFGTMQPPALPLQQHVQQQAQQQAQQQQQQQQQQEPQLQQQQQAAFKADPPVRRPRPAPQRSRSRLWSMLSQGDLDSIQNALDEYVAKGGGMDDDIFSGQLRTLPTVEGDVLEAAALEGAGRKRKPPRSNNSFLLMGADSLGLSGLSKLGLNLFEEESDDSFRADDIVGKLSPSPLLPIEPLEEGGETGQGANATRMQAPVEPAAAPQGGKHHRPVARQFTVSSISPRAAFEKMAAEVETLRAENQRLKQAARSKPNHSSAMDATREFELEQQLMEGKSEIKLLRSQVEAAEQREQKAQERARAAEDRSTALAAELAKSRADLGALLAKFSMPYSGLQLPMPDQFANNNKPKLNSGGAFDLSGQLALMQHQQQRHQQQQHEAGLFGGGPSSLLGGQGHVGLSGQGLGAGALSGLHGASLGMGNALQLGHTR